MFGSTGHSTTRGLKHGMAAALIGLTMVVAMTASPVAAADPSSSAKLLFNETPTTDWAALQRAAARDGSVPVIVQLTVDARRADSLSPTKHHEQKVKIAKSRETLLVDDLHKTKPRGLKVSNDLPLVAFDATADDVSALQKSRNTRAVTIDREISVDLGAPVGKGKTTSKVPERATVAPIPNGNGAAGTSSNGNGIQLTNWWDWYRIGVDKTSAAGWTGAGQTIAVLDTGVDRNHSWLQGKVVAEACFSYLGQAGTVASGGCPNGSNVQYGTGAAAPCTYSFTCAHGTHTAHTAAGRYGVASGANIVAVQIFHDSRDATHSPTYFESDVVWGLNYVYNLRTTYRIAAINMSIGSNTAYIDACDGGPGDGTTNITYLAGWVDALKAVGIATVVSTGNGNISNGISRPSCIRNAVAVGNTTYDANGYDAVFGNVSIGSNSGALLDILAPGTDICSAVPVNLDNDGVKDGVGCGWIGTSMAAPHVAGAIAVLRQKRAAATVDTILSTLQRTGVSVRDDRNGIVRSRINLVGALNGI